MLENDIQKTSPAVRGRLITGALVAVLAVGAIILVAAALARASESRARLAPLLARVDELRHVAVEHAELTKELEAIHKTMGDPDEVVGSGAASNRVADAVHRVAKSSGVAVQRVLVQPVTGGRATHNPYITAGVRATLNCKIQNLGKFLEGIRDDPAVAGLTQVTIDGDPKKPGQLNVTVTAVTLAREGEDAK